MTKTKTVRRRRVGSVLLVTLILLCGNGVMRSAAAHSRRIAAQEPKNQTRSKSPLPPLIRPTSPTPTPLTARQTAEHDRKIHAALRQEPEVAPPMPERMLSLEEIDARVAEERRKGSVFDLIERGDPNRKEIALTFDDGPHPTFTPRLLDMLKRLNVHATFFLVGEKVDQAPYLIARMIQEGHDVGNHTYHHLNLTRLSPELAENEIRLCNEAVRRACGQPPIFFRPPGGQFDTQALQDADKLRMITVLWTDDPADYARPGAAVIEDRLLGHVRSGAVILLHDGVEQTLEILPDLVARLRREGYRFVTLSDLAQHLETQNFAQR